MVRPRLFVRRRRHGFALAATLSMTGLPWINAQEIRFQDRAEVARVVVDVRVVDGRGQPILGLTPSDFRVRVDGKEVPLESAHWVSGATPYAEGLDPGLASAAGLPSAPPGRLIVFFFQKDHRRLEGLMRMTAKAAEMLGSLTPEDRVAVLSFDTHLRLWLDFTGDRESLRRVVRRSVLRERPRPVEPGPFPSLAAHFDPGAARRCASPETALLLIARSLEPLPGSKSLVFFGWGLGRLSRSGVHMEPDYEPARRALAKARVTVFSLDISDADYHSLEIGLERIAEDTGGFYAKTHLFPAAAMTRLDGALVGYYVLAFEKPPLPPGRHSLSIDLVRHKGRVLAKTSYEG